MENWNERWWNLLFIVFFADYRSLRERTFIRERNSESFIGHLKMPNKTMGIYSRKIGSNAQVNLCLLITFLSMGWKYLTRDGHLEFRSFEGCGLSLLFVLKFVENFLIDCNFIGNQWTWTSKGFSDFHEILFKKFAQPCGINSQLDSTTLLWKHVYHSL